MVPILHGDQPERLRALLGTPTTLPAAVAAIAPAVDLTTCYVVRIGAQEIPPAVETEGGVWEPGVTTEAELYQINDDGELEAVVDDNDAPVTVEVYNTAPVESDANTFLPVLQELASGKLILAQATCPKYTEHQLIPWGFPTAGDVSLNYTVPNPFGSNSSGTVTLPWDCTAEAAEAAFVATFAFLADVVQVFDGPWPYAGLWVTFRGYLKGRFIDAPAIDVSGLEGGAFPQVLFLRRWVT